MNFLNHLMNGCDKKDVTSFSKQNNNFIEIVGFAIHFKMYIVHMVSCTNSLFYWLIQIS